MVKANACAKKGGKVKRTHAYPPLSNMIPMGPPSGAALFSTHKPDIGIRERYAYRKLDVGAQARAEWSPCWTGTPPWVILRGAYIDPSQAGYILGKGRALARETYRLDRARMVLLIHA